MDRGGLMTEKRLAASAALDAMSPMQIVELMNAEDRCAVDAVGRESADIARAVEIVTAAVRSGGRLFYVGAGTSGRLGVLDAAECPPTFRTDPALVQGILAGGEPAMFKAQEGVEDRADDGAAAIIHRNVSASDVVMGIAAGGTTPFVQALSGAGRLAAEPFSSAASNRSPASRASM